MSERELTPTDVPDDEPRLEHTRPEGVTDATIEALGKYSEALEVIEDARGSLYRFHRLTGKADLAIGEAVELFRKAGHDEIADRIEREVIGRNVLEGRWTFQVMEEYDDGYYAAVKASDLTMVATGTPFDGRRIDLSYVERAAAEIGAALARERAYHVVVVKSTVVPGTTDGVVLPILERMASVPLPPGRRRVRVLVLAPTRELAAQVGESFAAYGRHLPFRRAVVFGGVGYGPQVDALARGSDIVVATPGRLLDLLHRRQADLSHVEVLVLDEADRMLDMGFLPDVRRVLDALPSLRGKNLACWCALPKKGDPDNCHAALLLELANR